MTVGRWTSSTHFFRNVKSALTTLLYLNFIWTLKSSLPNHSPFVMISRVGFFMQVAQFSTIMQRRMTLLKTTSTWYILEVIWIKIRFPLACHQTYSYSSFYHTKHFSLKLWVRLDYTVCLAIVHRKLHKHKYWVKCKISCNSWMVLKYMGYINEDWKDLWVRFYGHYQLQYLITWWTLFIFIAPGDNNVTSLTNWYNEFYYWYSKKWW